MLTIIGPGGIGRELLKRAFPGGGERKSIIATTDARAQALYLKSGVYPRFPLYFFSRKPESVVMGSDLVIKSIQEIPAAQEILAGLDEEILGFRREADHSWLPSDRDGYLYFREGQSVGYGYLGIRNGPFALLNPDDFPAVLAHAESQAATQGRHEFGLELPMVNQAAVDYLLGRGFLIDSFVAIMINDQPWAIFENYILTSPFFFL